MSAPPHREPADGNLPSGGSAEEGVATEDGMAALSEMVEMLKQFKGLGRQTLGSEPLPASAGPLFTAVGQNLANWAKDVRSTTTSLAASNPLSVSNVLTTLGNGITTVGADLSKLPSPFSSSFTNGRISNIVSALTPPSGLPFLTSLNPLSSILNPPTVDPAIESFIRQGATDPSISTTLAILANVFNLVAAILYIVSGALGTIASSLGLLPAGLALVTGPVGFWLSAESFAITLSQDTTISGLRDKVYAVWSQGLSQVADSLSQINNGTLRQALGDYKSQLSDSSSLVQAAQAKYNQWKASFSPSSSSGTSL